MLISRLAASALTQELVRNAHLRPTDPETAEEGLSKSVLNKPWEGFWCMLRSEEDCKVSTIYDTVYGEKGKGDLSHPTSPGALLFLFVPRWRAGRAQWKQAPHVYIRLLRLLGGGWGPRVLSGRRRLGLVWLAVYGGDAGGGGLGCQGSCLLRPPYPLRGCSQDSRRVSSPGCLSPFVVPFKTLKCISPKLGL